LTSACADAHPESNSLIYLSCRASLQSALVLDAYASKSAGAARNRLGTEGNPMTVTTRTVISDNAAGAISYFTFFPAIVFLLFPPFKESSYIRFHAWQSVLLAISAFLIDIILGTIALLTLFLGTITLIYTFRIISLLWLVLWLVCVIKAMTGKRFRIPLLGSIAEKLAMK
jgi:uncharacterized membrane protein